MRTDALFSLNRKYRFWLTRVWDEEKPMCAFIGLNPSTADETTDDRTILKCIKYARSWEHGGLLMLNLYAFRATDPKDLWAAREKWLDVVGGIPNHFEALQGYLAQFRVTRRIAAWGSDTKQAGRGLEAKLQIPKLDFLMKAKNGQPKHPLYLPDGLLSEPWNY
jgi:hypothetical protein